MFSIWMNAVALLVSVVDVGVGGYVLIKNESIGSTADIYPIACFLGVFLLLSLLSLAYGVVGWCTKKATILYATDAFLSIVALFALGIGFILVVT